MQTTRYVQSLLVFLIILLATPTQGFLGSPRVSYKSGLQTQPVSTISNSRRHATTVGDEPSKSVTDSIAYKIFDFLMNVPLFHDILFGVYRTQAVDKAEAIGIRWRAHLEELNNDSEKLKIMAAELTQPGLVIPQYYYAPIHAYAEGNLCWDSAIEEDLWSKLMIAPLFNGRTDGDVKMRQNWIDTVQKVLGDGKAPGKVLDQGCGTGLSMYLCQEQWPTAEFTGVDLSTYKLAISERKRRSLGELGNRVVLKHAPAEATGLDAGVFDLATICLVNHESPLWVSKAMFAEAFRCLKPGGLYTILDLDKENLEILMTSPFVAAIYKQTEPYVQDFIALNMKEALEEAGFVVEKMVQASKSHKAIVARKPVSL